jgi:hypothetical protein
MEKRRPVSHADVKGMLQKAGYTEQQIDDVLRDVPDPIDPERHCDAFVKQGVSLGSLVDRMGGSP